MKPFNLKEYLENPSLQVVTRDGRSARIICTNAIGNYPVVALILNENKDTEHAHRFKEDGSFIDSGTNSRDLFFSTTKHEGWVNIYGMGTGSNFRTETGEFYNTKEEALQNRTISASCIYLNTVHIEWEE